MAVVSTMAPHDSDSDSGSDVDFVNVDFDFQAPSESDYQALKRLFQQLFYTHAPGMDMGTIADWVIRRGQQDGVGTVVKVDDAEELRDPYAVVTGTPLHKDVTDAAPRLLYSYFTKQLGRVASGKPMLELLERSRREAPLLYVVHERMVNMPVQLMLPLLRMALEELEEERNESTPPGAKPTHALFFSRAFSAEALEEEDEEDEEPTGLAGARKRKAKGDANPDDASAAALGKKAVRKQVKQAGRPAGKAARGDNLGSFHPEDEVIGEVRTRRDTCKLTAVRQPCAHVPLPAAAGRGGGVRGAHIWATRRRAV